MELANGKKNKFFSVGEETVNRYMDTEDFTAQYEYVSFLSTFIEDGSTVLDIGCGQGRFGKVLKGKNCLVYGIELDSVAAQYALNTGGYQDVYVMDLLDDKSEIAQKMKNDVMAVDYIILSDVLEHLENPTEALIKYYDLLKDTGKFIVSVPNIANVDIALNLLNGKFNYTDMGILDNTHLKFFTKESFFDWVGQINEVYDNIHLSCKYLGCTRYESEYIEFYKNNHETLYSILSLQDGYNSFQLFFMLSKEQKNNFKSLERTIDIVEILGQLLRGEVSDYCREVYTKIAKEKEELESGIKWHQENDEKSQVYMQMLEKRSDELEASIEWYQENEKRVQDYQRILEERNRNLEIALTWHQENDEKSQAYIQMLDKRNDELEASVEWYQENEKTVQDYQRILEGRTRELETALTWHHENNKASQAYGQLLESRIEELNCELEWYKDNSLKQNDYISSQETYIESLNSSLEEQKSLNKQLMKKIVDIESSLAWRMVRFFSKK